MGKLIGKLSSLLLLFWGDSRRANEVEPSGGGSIQLNRVTPFFFFFKDQNETAIHDRPGDSTSLSCGSFMELYQAQFELELDLSAHL